MAQQRTNQEKTAEKNVKKAPRKGLGRGLEALLGDIGGPVAAAAEEAAKKEDFDGITEEIKKNQIVPSENREGLLEVPLTKLDPNREQARKSFDETRMMELAQSIEQSGVIQPLLVQQNGDRYTIIAGERRWRAARMAGLKTVPVLVRQYDERTLMEVSLVENLQRTDLNPIEEAAGIKLLMDQHDLTQEEVATRLGKSRSAIANSVRLLNLSEPVLALLREGRLSAGHARCLVALENREIQARLAREIVDKGLSVRQTEVLCKAAGEEEPQEKSPRAASKRSLSPEMFDVQNTLQRVLGTKVNLAGTEKRGKITIEYYSRDDLERIYELLRPNR